MQGPRDAQALLASGRLDAALDLSQALVDGPAPDAAALTVHAAVLKAHGRLLDALAANRAAVARFPTNGLAWHNLAATLGDMDRPDEAEAAAHKAIGLGVRAPETRLVLARALQAQGRYEAAQTAFGEALALRPDYVDAHRDLAQLIWMRTADAAAALQGLDRTLSGNPGHVGLLRVKAILLQHAGDPGAALEVAQAALARAPADVGLLSLAMHMASDAGEPGAALGYAKTAARAAPGSQAVDVLLATAFLGTGEADLAEAAAQRAVDRAPEDQLSLALLATAWRMKQDPRYGRLYDYDAFVRAYDLEAPAGWSGMAAFIEDLTAALGELHGFVTHPFSQSLRHGSQATLRLDGANAGPIEALLALLRERVAAYEAALGPGSDPFRARATRGAEITGAWSVRLTSSGYHENHVHPRGWLSSACYIGLPETTGPDLQAGWIKFGEPGVRTLPALPAEHLVQPRVGRLVLFPAYMWHGTVPFASTTTRLSVAFDARPK
jgi:tetratricopeptide (TPR) repeat protein